MADELRLKVSQADYQKKMQAVKSKMDELATIYKEYSDLKLKAYKVLGEGDSNTQKLMESVEKNMEAVGRQHAALAESWEKLNEQNEKLGVLSSDIGKILDDAKEQIESKTRNAFSILSDL